MSESLSILAERVAKQADRLLTHKKSATLLNDLSERQKQLRNLNSDLQSLQPALALLLEVDPKLRVPRKRLSPRLKTLRKLEEKVAIDPVSILPPEALDVPGLKEAIDEINNALMKRWGEFAKPEGSAQALENLGEDKAVADTVRQLKVVRGDLEARQAKLPSKRVDIDEVRKLKKRIQTFADQLAAYGYEDDILLFIKKARESRGIPIAEVLKNPKLRKWLEDGKHAANFRIVHESVLHSGELYRR